MARKVYTKADCNKSFQQMRDALGLDGVELHYDRESGYCSLIAEEDGEEVSVVESMGSTTFIKACEMATKLASRISTPAAFGALREEAHMGDGSEQDEQEANDTVDSDDSDDEGLERTG